MGLVNLFKSKKKFFPAGNDARREVILRVHHDISGNDDIVKPDVIDTLLEVIEKEKDAFQIDSTVIYYIGYYKPFADHNEDTAKVLADSILLDKGIRIIDNEHSVYLFHEGCTGAFTIDSIVEWQKGHYEKV